MDPINQKVGQSNPLTDPTILEKSYDTETGWKGLEQVVHDQNQEMINKTKPNDPCPCKSGMKFGRCCLKKLVGKVVK